MLPSFDFAAQYALLSKFNNYDVYYNAFQRNNATIGVSIVFPFSITRSGPVPTARMRRR